jgi:type 1 fimbria pilin
MNRAKGIVLACLAACLPARADYRLEFQVRGAITPSCGLASGRILIDLGSVSAGELPAPGAASRWHRSAFIGVDCIGATRASVTLRAPPYAGDPRYVATIGEARGVAIQMQSADGQPLPPDGSTPVHFSWAGNRPELGFRARYVRVGALRPGNAGATAQVQILWE